MSLIAALRRINVIGGYAMASKELIKKEKQLLIEVTDSIVIISEELEAIEKLLKNHLKFIEKELLS